MEDLGAEPLVMDGAPGLRLSFGDWSAGTAQTATDEPPMDLPPRITTDAPAPGTTPKPRSPSDLGGAKALPGEGLSEDLAKERGTLIHALLEHLPAIPPEQWAQAARVLLKAADPALDPAELEAEARAVITSHPDIFGPDTLAEVPFSANPLPGDDAPLSGIIDRLIITPQHILCVDFKSNMVVPDRPEDTPLGVLRQMGAYLHALKPLYPDHHIQPVILWTRTATRMEYPHDLVTQALQTTASG
jgi:ATP-dependent helicase/nuclease subunit A